MPAYIHRAGRTARFKRDGQALLLLLPSEESGFVSALRAARVPIQRQRLATVGPSKANDARAASAAGVHGRDDGSSKPGARAVISASQKASSLVAADAERKRLAQKAFVAYVRSVLLMRDKSIFDVEQLPFEEARDQRVGAAASGHLSSERSSTPPAPLAQFALSLGLAAAPPLRFLTDAPPTDRAAVASAEGAEAARDALRSSKNVNRKLARLKEQIRAEKERKRREAAGASGEASSEVADAASRASARPADTIGSDVEDDDDDAGGLVVVRRHEAVADGDDANVCERKPKKAKRMRITHDGVDVSAANTKTRFDADDRQRSERSSLATLAAETQTTADVADENLASANDAFVETVRARMKSAAAEDRAREKERLRAKRRKQKDGRPRDDHDDAGAALAGAESASDSDSEGESQGESSDGSSSSR